MPTKTIGFMFVSPPLDNASTLNEPDHQNNQCQNQQDVDKSTHGVRSDQSQQPQHEQNHENCPQHGVPLSEPIGTSLASIKTMWPRYDSCCVSLHRYSRSIRLGSPSVSVGQSCWTTLCNDLLTRGTRWPWPYWMKPSFLNLFMKKLTRDLVVPTISASISC